MESFDTTKKYYKGDIVLLGKKNSSSEKLIASYNYLQKKLQFKESFTDHEKSILSGYLNAISKSCRATRKDVVEIFSKMFNNETLGKLNIESVVLPIIYTKESDSVAREVHSGAVFPILSADNVDFDYFIEVEDYPDELTSNYKVHAASKISFANLNKIKVAIVSEKEATLEETRNYQNMFRRLFGNDNKKKLAYQERISNLAKKNECILISSKSMRQDIRLSLMERVEYELTILDSKNPELSKEINKTYKKLQKDELTVENLIWLLNEIEVIETFDLDYRTDILGYISRVKEIYLTDFENNVDREPNMAYVSKIADIFYKQQNSYSAMEKRAAEVDLAYIYLIEVYRNKDIIDINTLETTYFKELLKTIVICLKVLEKEGAISITDIDLEEELNVFTVFNYIKNLKVRNNSMKK